MNIGIIGGSDGPTAIYVSSGNGWYLWAAAAAGIIAAIVIIYKIRKKRKGRE